MVAAAGRKLLDDNSLSPFVSTYLRLEAQLLILTPCVQAMLIKYNGYRVSVQYGNRKYCIGSTKTIWLSSGAPLYDGSVI